MTVQVDIRRIDAGEPLQVVFHGFPMDGGVAMRILIASSVGDIDSVARWLRAAADRLESGTFASRAHTDPDDDTARIPAGRP